MSAPVTLLSRLRATDVEAADVLAGRLTDFAQAVPAEPGNLAYRVFRAQEDATTFFIEECWSLPEDAERHVRRVAADPAAQQSSALLAAPVETATLVPVGTAVPDHDGRTTS